MLPKIRWTVVALHAAVAAPAFAEHDGTPHDRAARPCAYEGYDAIRMQAPDGACAPNDADADGSGAGEPQRAEEAPTDPFVARIWTGP